MPPATDWTYQVRPGDNLWRIGERYLDRPSRAFALARYNRIADPHRMRPGTQVRVPLEWLAAREESALVVAASGAVDPMAASGGAGRPLAVGDRVGAGQEIGTGASGSVILEMPDASQLRLNASSRIRIDTLRRFGDTGITDTRITIKRGSTEGIVTPVRPPASRFEINTPAAVTAVRGTGLRVGTGAGEASSPTRVEVVSGRVASGNAQGATEIAGGFGLRIDAARPPGLPLPLLPAPTLDGTPKVVDRLPVEFGFPPAPDAQGWRVQIAPAAISGAPAAVQVDRVENAPRVRAGALADGDYRLAVRAIDGNGIEGIDAVRTFAVRARPEPPVLVEPAPGAALTAAQPSFGWAVDAAASGYRLQVSTRSDFRDPVLDTIVEGTARAGAHSAATPLPPGQYHWRVATRERAGDIEREGPFSDTQSFRRLVPGPSTEAPEAGTDRIVLRWRASADARAYQFQLAADAGFDKPVAEAEVSTPSADLPRPPPGRYWLRVRAIDNEGQPGPYGAAQSFELVAAQPPPARWPWLLLPAILILIGL